MTVLWVILLIIFAVAMIAVAFSVSVWLGIAALLTAALGIKLGAR